MQFGVRENPGRYDNLDYDNDNDNDNGSHRTLCPRCPSSPLSIGGLGALTRT